MHPSNTRRLAELYGLLETKNAEIRWGPAGSTRTGSCRQDGNHLREVQLLA